MSRGATIAPESPTAPATTTVPLGDRLRELDSASTDTALEDSAAFEESASARERISGGIAWPTLLWLSAVHLGALAAPFFFSWTGLAVALGLQFLTGCIGICLGFHRLFTHRSFKTTRPVRWLVSVIGQLAGEGSVVDWVADHRKHHALSDQPGDPHSPRDGRWWSHMFWFLWKRSPEEREAYQKRWAPDLRNDRVLRIIDRSFLPLNIGLGFLLFAIGYATVGVNFGISLVVWGMFVRMTFVLHSTWLVNSASHLWGYRTYDTRDDSRNNWFVALISYGEGWHNNHHAYPAMARAGHKWWEYDVTFGIIRVLEKCGLVWDIVDGHHVEESDTPERKAA